MDDRKRILTAATLVMVCLAAVVTAAGTLLTYRAALTEKQAELRSLALREVQGIETILGHGSKDHKPSDHADLKGLKDCPECATKVALVMHLMRENGNLQSGWGEGVEFVVGTRDGDDIRFLLRSRHAEQDDIRHPMEIPWASDLAEPMRLALSGESGIIEAEDYRGAAVLAAYAPVKVVGWGVVAKIDMAEMRAPFVVAVRNSCGLAVLAIALGLIVLRQRLNPLIQRSQDSEDKANRALAIARSQKNAMDEHSIIAITDPSGRITYVNDKFCEISQYSRDEVIGQDHRIINSGHHPRSFFAEMWKTIAGGAVWHAEVRNRAKDGSLYWVDTTIVPFKDEAGCITEYVSIRTDITERKKTEDALTESLEQADAANRAKSEFLANMSHEIRTPMTAILGFSENMLDASQPEMERLNCIHTIRRTGEQLLNLINDILDLSKMEAGRMTVERGDCQPCRVMADVASLMRVRADAKGLPFNIEYIGAIPEIIQSAPARLRQILINLIGNAIKFTDAGAVRVVTRFVDDADVPYLQFDVIDTGRGMKQADVAKLFLPFIQADNSSARTFGGTGLGLTISKRFAQLLGGDISVPATELDVGTTFRVTVATGPVDRVRMLEDPSSETVSTSATAGQASHDDLRGYSILLAEDSPDNQRLISFVLQKAGAAVTVAENGWLALNKALAAMNRRRADDPKVPFDVILMDMQMPVMDGYEATAQLRLKGYTRPIIALTAHAMAGDREKCINAGCDDYATKPIDRAKLIALVKSYASREEPASPTEETTPAPLGKEPIDDRTDEAGAVAGEALEGLGEQMRGLAALCRQPTDGVAQPSGGGDVAAPSKSNETEPAAEDNGAVLVVDDDPDTRKLFRRILERDGFDVHEACDGVDALAQMPTIRPQVILMDVEMPNMGGLECTRQLKGNPSFRDIPIIIVSAKTDSLHVRAGLEAGAQEYITKPIQRDEFLLRVRSMNQLCRGEANLLKSNAVRGEQARAMGVLFDLSRELAAADSLDAIAGYTVEAAAELLHSHRVSVMLPNDTGEKLLIASAIGIDAALASKIEVPIGSAIAGKVFASGEPTIFNSQSDTKECTRCYESDFFVSVPLASKALSVPNKVVGVLNVTERHDRQPFQIHEIEYLDLLCNMTASAIEQFRSGEAREHAHAAIVIGLAKLAEHRDSDTGRHVERVTQFALLLARGLRKSPQYADMMDSRFLLSLEQAMPLHDIGKVSVPDAILLKPDKLTDSEYSAVKQHAGVGADAIQSMIEQAPEATFLVIAREIAHSHHEWFDGTGYPRQLAGDDIPLAARIAAVADVYDALTTERPYKKAFPHEKAVDVIRDASGSQFDPGVVDVFLLLERRFAELAQELRDECEDPQEETANPQLAACATAASDHLP